MLKKELKSVFISLFGYSWDLDKRLYLRYEYTTGIWIDVKLNDKGKKQYPYDPFALQKACLLACGIIPSEGGSLDEILTRLGGGFEMHSEVTNVPKGSGLGTSSILSAACVKAVFEFMGISYTEEELYAHVLVMELIICSLLIQF